MPAFDSDNHFFKEAEASNLSLGQNGGELISDTSAHTGKYYALLFLADTTFTSMTGNISGTWTGRTFAANTVIPGRFSAFTLATGALIAYKYEDA